MKERNDRSRIYLLRHGSTEAVEKGIIYGKLDVSVSDKGFADLDEYKEKRVYANINAKNFITSGMLRTKQTLERIFGVVDSYVIEDLSERDYGSYEGTTVNNLSPSCRFYLTWTDGELNNGDERLKGMEALKCYRARVLSGFNQLWEKHMNSYGDTVAILHHGSISNIMSALFSEYEDVYIGPGRGFEIRIIGSKVLGYSEV